MPATVALFSIGFVAAFIAAALIGYAVQRGATCLVAAMDELVSKRRGHRLIAMGEAALWVAGGMLVLNLLGLLPAPTHGVGVTVATIAGGAVLGLGALVNRACVFGTVARIGNGEWAYWLTPLGLLAGCYAFDALGMGVAPRPIDGGSLLYPLAAWLAVPIALFVLWRGVTLVRAARRREFGRYVWHPHQATALIGAAYVVMLPLVGSWAYSDAIADLALGRTDGLALRLGLLVALFLGALTGGWTAGRLRWVPPRPVVMARCFAGGVLLGFGAMLVPGTNDGLILFGMPLLYPYAWIAVGGMALTIWLGLRLDRMMA